MSANSATIEGIVAPGFEKIKDAFSRNFREYDEKGASVAIYVDGEKKVDLWGGTANVQTGRPWQANTIGLVYSATKGAVALLFQLLAQKGILDLDEPVARYWPEFAAAGKSGIPVRFLLSHQAGLPGLDQPITSEEILEGRRIVEILQNGTPIWEPGAKHGYHALTYGWLLGAVVQKVTGKSLGQVFKEHIADPLSLDFHIGLPTSELDRVAKLVQFLPLNPAIMAEIPDPEAIAALESVGQAMSDPDSLLSRVLSTNGALRTPDAETWNDPRIYAAEIPAANAITNARSLAKMYAACVSEVDGIRLLDADSLADSKREQAIGMDEVLGLRSRFGTGFELPVGMAAMLSEESFGHKGAGGALGFGDTKHRVGFGYVQNQLLGYDIADPRTRGLIAALKEAIA